MFKIFKGWLSFRRGADRFLKYPEGKRIYREFHSLRNSQMDPDGVKIISRLNRYGYKAYFVGGCVRDLLLGKRPKDFDIVTNATPMQLRKLFSNSRVIGRRFKIVHIVFKAGKIIEVSTFRSLPEHRLHASSDEDMYLKRDNIFGTPKEDVARRDFTINSLYYDPRNESIVDYTGGFDGIKNRQLNVIGDPDISFKEDPVRMLRAAKFAPLLGFQMHSACVKGIRKNRLEILKANSNRLLEEYFKIFRTGRASEIFESMYETGLLEALLPTPLAATLERSGQGVKFTETPLGKRLVIADRMLAEREDLTLDIFLALLYADLVKDVFLPGDWNHNEHIAEYVKSRLAPAYNEMKLPGRDRSWLLQIFMSQMRFHSEVGGRRKSKRTDAFREKPYFFDAFVVFKIHSLTEGDDDAVQRAMFWEIGPRHRPPDSGRTVSTFHPARHRRSYRDNHDSHTDEASRNGRPASHRSHAEPTSRSQEHKKDAETTSEKPVVSKSKRRRSKKKSQGRSSKNSNAHDTNDANDLSDTAAKNQAAESDDIST